MNCIYLKQKLNHSLECKKKKCTINIKDCTNCGYKEYKTTCPVTKQHRQKSKNLTKLERNRKSVFTNDLEHCILCGNKKDNLHEIFFGKNRLNSIKYNFVIPLCFDCHSKMHINNEWQEFWHIKGQLYFESNIGSRNEFIGVFGKSYISKK